ncbi:hypothetical protein LV89_03825 [Arcicella aurantiaca]|uniref:Uncharacterized protein n=1 Tax=Arcicella aurantiaca TaxID=591202 RepID=A0A316DS53_9BACT|nr:hypothetical protein [Arcicella aurantiaca]PWK20282.1 hypothetical protein LV89_03825 [Arcicella aurantiaca]
MANEVIERHKAEMQMLHKNQMEGEDLFRRRLSYLKARKDGLLHTCPNIEQMNEVQRRNYDFINDTIEELEFFHRTQTAYATKYKNLYDETIGLIKKDFVPKIKQDVIVKLIDQFNESITDNFLQEILKNKE